MSRQSEDPVDVAVRNELEHLRKLEMSEIECLPLITESGTLPGGGSLMVWHDVLSGDEHRVVVQGIRPILFGL